MVTVTAGFLPPPSASTTSGGTSMPVAVLPCSSTVVVNLMAPEDASCGRCVHSARSRASASGVLGRGSLLLGRHRADEPPVGELEHAQLRELPPVAGPLHAAE